MFSELLCHRASLRLSACLSVTQVQKSKMVDFRIMQYPTYGVPISLVFAGKFQLEILTGLPGAGASNKGGVEKQAISSFMRQNLENGRR